VCVYPKRGIGREGEKWGGRGRSGEGVEEEGREKGEGGGRREGGGKRGRGREEEDKGRGWREGKNPEGKIKVN